MQYLYTIKEVIILQLTYNKTEWLYMAPGSTSEYQTRWMPDLGGGALPHWRVIGEGI